LLSDHGTSLGLHGDRAINANKYEGDPINIKKLAVAKYSGTPVYSLDFKKDFGVDTSYGYGGDVLSLKQYRTVLAFKGYGIDIGKNHRITDRTNVIDIAPTILDLTKLTSLKQADGVSLTPYFHDTNRTLTQPRSFYLETTFSIDEIEKEGISVEKVLNKTIQLYQVDLKNGLIFVKHSAEMSMNKNKERAILQGDWLLARYPSTQETSLVNDKNSLN
jgi:hypothetical protein